MRVLVACSAAILTLMAAKAAGADEIVTLKTREGVTQSFTLLVSEKPAASVILFPGGNGKTPLDKLQPGQFINKGNFLVRILYELKRNGLAVAIVDAPSDRQDVSGMFGTFRGSDEHARDIAVVVDYLRAKAAIPVWLVGTSAGTESVASLTTKLGSRIDGAVLTSSISVRYRRGFSVFEFPIDVVRVPVLVIGHKDDECQWSPGSQTQHIAESFSASSRKKALIFEGGDPPRSEPCEALAQHGFVGIEKKVAATIADFVKER